MAAEPTVASVNTGFGTYLDDARSNAVDARTSELAADAQGWFDIDANGTRLPISLAPHTFGATDLDALTGRVLAPLGG